MRLIDADALPIQTVAVRCSGKSYYDVAMAWLFAIVDAAPTSDAVPVVRCKDCVAVTRWGSELVCSRISEVMDGYYHGTVEIVKPDDYCSQGIRSRCAKMDGGAEDEHKGT